MKNQKLNQIENKESLGTVHTHTHTHTHVNLKAEKESH